MGLSASTLFQQLWNCTTLAEALVTIQRVPHAHQPLGGRRNNKANVKTNFDGIASIIEGVTNGHDAVIRYWKEQGQFQTAPTTVTAALQEIANTTGKNRRILSFVDVMMHLKHGNFKAHHAVTIIDQGIGMDEKAMKAGPLTFGSEDKVLDPTQFGSFGQGSASLFSHSKFSLIASIRARTPTLVFTGVWLDQSQPIHSYVYLTRPDGSLFDLDIATLPHAKLSEGLATLLGKNSIILPRQGTIRRQLQMEGIKEYFTTRDYGLYNGLHDRLFGCPAYVRLSGDDDEGHLNHRRGRRYEFNSISEGKTLPKTNIKLLKHLPPIKIAVHHKTEPVGFCHIEAWVFSSWTRKSKKRTAGLEIATPVRDMLEGPATNGSASKGILITYNGQTLLRLASTPIYGNAGLRAIAENLIVEITLDDLDPGRLQDAEFFLSSRENVVEWFQRVLVSELTRYLKAQEDLKILALEMEPPTTENSSDANVDYSSEVNKFLRDPIFGRGLGYATNTISPNGTGAFASAPGETINPSNGQGHGPRVQSAHHGEPEKRKYSRPEPIALVDPPTVLLIRKATIVRSATNWIVIHTNAQNHYGPMIKLTLPKYLKLVDPGVLRDGRLTVPVSCDHTALGTKGTVTVTLSTGAKKIILTDRREVEIVTRNEIPKKAPKPNVDGSEPQARVQENSPPTTRLIFINGPDHSMWSRFFNFIDQPETAAINYYLEKDENRLMVGVHTGFAPLLELQDDLADRFGRALSKHYLERIGDQLQVTALTFCRNSLLGDQGANDADYLTILTDIARGIVVYQATLYRNRGFRNAVLAGLKADKEDDG